MKKFLLTLSACLLLGLAASAADLTITAASFVPGARAVTSIGTAGASITTGQLLYFDTVSKTYKLADANVTITTASCIAIAGSTAAAGQPLIVITADDDLTLGATLSLTAPLYIVSATAGGIAPVADFTTGMFPAAVLVAKSTTKCIFNPAVLWGPTVSP